MVNLSTRIMSDAKHTSEDVYRWASKNGAKNLPFLKKYLDSLYDLGRKTGVNADLAAMQSAHETGDKVKGIPWQSEAWVKNGNPAGFGITGNTNQNIVFATGTQAARMHIAHLLLYATGKIDLAGLTPDDDKRYNDYVKYFGAVPKATTLNDLQGKWAEDPQYAKKIVKKAEECFGKDTEMVFGKVPYPAVEKHLLTKAPGHGQDNLGKRTVKGVVLHRMIGTLRGTLSYFSSPNVNSLTDYGIGVAGTDAQNDDGKIIQFNDPLGYQSGWASGPVAKPYGDGLAFVNKYGINAVNRDQASIEISGNYDTALTVAAKKSIAALIAYWADQYNISWEKFPIGPEGFSFVRWHQEFTIGSGKICPGPVVMNATTEIIKMAQAIMKEYQMDSTTNVPGDVTPPDVPEFTEPGDIPPVDGTDYRFHDADWYACARRVKVKAKDLPRLANTSSAMVKAAEDLHQSDSFDAVFALKGKRSWFWVTKEGYRIPMEGTTPKASFVV